MNVQERITALSKLGKLLSQVTVSTSNDLSEPEKNSPFLERLKGAIQRSGIENQWFTESNVFYSIDQWSKLLTSEALSTWVSNYHISEPTPKVVAIIMAGNIPLVGFHDLLSVLIAGHKALVKQSSNDKVLLNTICDILVNIEPRFKSQIQFTNEQLTNFDAVIATGSNNTARYFEHYFGKHPNIIRKNRNSVAVLNGDETQKELENLSDDIFRYYGLGCRNVSKLYVPQGYNFDAFFNAVYKWHPIIHEHKYANNYDYNKAVYLMSEYDMLDNGFLVLRMDEQLASPIATLNYEFYNNEQELKDKLKALSENIQCIVSNNFIENEINFGTTQQPGLNTYADGVDTVEFLLKI